MTHPHSRSTLEECLGHVLTRHGITQLKTGDLIGSDRSLPREVSRFVFNFEDPVYAGIIAPSSERIDGHVIGLFEAAPISTTLRADVGLESIIRARYDTDSLAKAIAYLGLIKITSQGDDSEDELV